MAAPAPVHDTCFPSLSFLLWGAPCPRTGCPAPGLEAPTLPGPWVCPLVLSLWLPLPTARASWRAGADPSAGPLARGGGCLVNKGGVTADSAAEERAGVKVTGCTYEGRAALLTHAHTRSCAHSGFHGNVCVKVSAAATTSPTSQESHPLHQWAPGPCSITGTDRHWEEDAYWQRTKEAGVGGVEKAPPHQLRRLTHTGVRGCGLGTTAHCQLPPTRQLCTRTARPTTCLGSHSRRGQHGLSLPPSARWAQGGQGSGCFPDQCLARPPHQPLLTPFTALVLKPPKQSPALGLCTCSSHCPLLSCGCSL